MRLLMVMFFCVFTASFGARANVDYLILKMNGSDTKITLKDLEELPPHSIITSTLYTSKEKFTGARFSDFAAKYNIKGSEIRVMAWDDYSYTLKVDEMMKYNVIIAYKKNDKYISIEDFGPFATIYPKDEYPELNKLDVDAKTVIQVKSLEVK